jgi:hypothetical protein
MPLIPKDPHATDDIKAGEAREALARAEGIEASLRSRLASAETRVTGLTTEAGDASAAIYIAEVDPLTALERSDQPTSLSRSLKREARSQAAMRSERHNAHLEPPNDSILRLPQHANDGCVSQASASRIGHLGAGEFPADGIHKFAAHVFLTLDGWALRIDQPQQLRRPRD